MSDSQIIAIGNAAINPDEIIDAAGLNIASGWIDIHLHGGGGADFMDGDIAAFQTITDYHLRHGATGQVPTAVSGTDAQIRRFLEGYRQAEESGLMRARLLGAHLEGPYLAKQRKGAHDEAVLRDPEPMEYRAWLETYPFIARMTAAVELNGALALGDCLREHGVNASIGHSEAYGEEITTAVAHGFQSVTHLYNAMSSVQNVNGKKAAGIAEMALLDDRLYVEVIADLVHVPKELVRLAHRVKTSERMILVSDCLAPAGQSEGVFRLGSFASGIAIDVKDAAYLHDTNKLAGSVVAADQLIKNAVAIGIPLGEALEMMSLTPAKLLGIDEILRSSCRGQTRGLGVLY
ncbi:MAG: amidohydrolase family protein [Bacillus subtilis]|nr:amidohydrolase family protein [Bacillus subtilis]